MVSSDGLISELITRIKDDIDTRVKVGNPYVCEPQMTRRQRRAMERYIKKIEKKKP